MGALRAPVLLAAMSCCTRVPRVHIRLLSSESRSDKSEHGRLHAGQLADRIDSVCIAALWTHGNHAACCAEWALSIAASRTGRTCSGVRSCESSSWQRARAMGPGTCVTTSSRKRRTLMPEDLRVVLAQLND